MLVPRPPDTDQVTIIFDHVAVGETRAVSRRNEGRPDKRQRIWPPCVWPESVSATRDDTRGKMSGSWASSNTGSSVPTWARVPGRSSTPRKRPCPSLDTRFDRRDRRAKSLPRGAEHHRIIFQDGNTHVARHGGRPRHRATNLVAKYRPRSEGRRKSRQLGRPRRVGNACSRNGTSRCSRPAKR